MRMFDSFAKFIKGLAGSSPLSPVEEPPQAPTEPQEGSAKSEALEQRMTIALLRGEAHVASGKVALEDFRQDHIGAAEHVNGGGPAKQSKPSKQTQFCINTADFEELRTRRFNPKTLHDGDATTAT